MKWNQVLGLLCLLVIVFPYTFILNPSSTPDIENRFQDNTPVLNSASIIEETTKTTSPSIDSSSEPLPPEEEPIETQEPPSSLTGDGAPRAATLYWNDTQGYLGLDNVTDVQVPLEDGELYYEALNFTRIEAHNLAFTVEDDWFYYYVSMGEDEPFFMSFRIEGTTPVRLNGFWAEFYGASNPSSQSRGPFNYGIFNATVPTDPRASSQPHFYLTEKLHRDLAPLSSIQWVWFDINETEVILDPTATYDNTFYVAIWEFDDTARMHWLAADDNASPNGDGVDEGDSYSFWTLDYYEEDFTLQVEIAPFNRYPLPSQLAIMVNGTPVLDLGPPGTGFWFNWPFPYPYNPGGLRYYDVDWLWPDYYQWPVDFDAMWNGKYAKFALTNTSFLVWVNQTVAQWTLNLTAQFPVLSSGRFIIVSIEEDWNVTEVRHSLVSGSLGSIHHNWTEFSDYVMIDRARSGIWTVFCDASNYMVQAEVLDILYQPVTDLYATETAIARGFVQNSFGANATNGDAWLLVFDPNGYLHIGFHEILPMPPGGLTEHNWDIWSSSYMGGVYTLLLFWANGTEVGLNASTLGVWHATQPLQIEIEYPEPGGELLRGEEAYVHFYYADTFGIPIGNAIISVINETSGFEYESYKVVDYSGGGNPGWYTVYIYTDNATIGVQNSVTIHVIKDYYDEQTYFKQFTVRSRVTHIVFLPGQGLENVTLPDNSTEWRTTPEPYINDTRLEFTILYTDYNEIPIEGAQLEPWLIKNDNATRLDWVDLYQEEAGEVGFYNITIDTNPVQGDVFHEGDFGVIIIKAFKLGYEPAWSHLPGQPGLIWVRPQPRPSWIDVPLEYQHIELYEDWLYPTPQHPNILRVILRDVLTGEDLSHGTVVLDVPGAGYVPLNLATPGLGLYEITDLNTTGATPGTYDFTLFATATDFTNATKTVRITIHPKQQISYDVNPTFQGPPNHNSRWSLDIQFRLESISPQFMTTSTDCTSPISSKQPGTFYLPEGTKVTLLITVQGGGSTQIEKYVEADGWIHFDGVFATEGQCAFYLTIDDAENYAGIPQESLQYNGGPFTVSVQSFGNYFLSNPLFIIAAVCAIVIPLGGGFSYRRYVLLPKRRRKLAKYQAIADTFSDVANLNRLLVLHKESGICVFDPFAAESQDATLVAGFLQAISTFGHDLADSPGLANGEKEEATLRELTYEGFRILIHDGHFVRNALVLSGQPSDQLRNRLENFTAAFEKRYRKDFENWAGRVDQFNGASDLVEEIFLISLRHPHSVAKRKPRNVQLTSLESDIYKLSKELTLDREYVFLGQILSTYLTAAKTDKRGALMGIYQLRVKGVYRPIQLDPITPPDTSAA